MSMKGSLGGPPAQTTCWRGFRELNNAARWKEKRKHFRRAEVYETAYIFSSGSSTRCRMLNVSDEGTALDVPNPSFIPERFQLMTERDRAIRNCRIVWIRQNSIGVAFE
jgi:hypothetical protein